MTACGTLQTVLSPRPEVPASLLTCESEPAPPEAPKVDTEVTDWINAALGAGADCRSKLQQVRGVLE